MENKVVMISGASRGLGRELAIAFGKAGAKLAICARGKKQLNNVKEELSQRGVEVIAMSIDVSQPAEIDRFVSVTEATYGQIDVLINNASLFGPGPTPLLDYSLASFQEVLAVNTIGPFLLTQRVLPGMLTHAHGRIINITSEAGQTGFAEWGAYGISKFAVEGLTQTWADELQETGVNMYMVDPGELDTQMHAIAVPDCEYPLTQPAAIVPVFLYLAGPQSAHLHGKRLQAQKMIEEDQNHE
ncbi:SDR family NAD(P)-dependent oxidoreductase [Mechercharimyces sp. CAU 1602]|uniref:SDR family NAD(P)-dependent oxidoreductase n=1 Tax=Mechercharimyces sp. CAU 1602 TaxID=2973933 RepID=UPI0021633EA2|nr:SDR family oxidoreductase [Mechercharimyces sp. CAU 1602]MCS1350767.1 SDR family oxidoreductase [Mechercharimyces sp. CAU 1602]